MIPVLLILLVAGAHASTHLRTNTHLHHQAAAKATVLSSYLVNIDSRDPLFAEVDVIGVLTGDLYLTRIAAQSPDYDINALTTAIQSKSYTIQLLDDNDLLLLFSFTKLVVTKDPSARPFVQVGDTNAIETILATYPITKFEFYATYNQRVPQHIIATYFNLGTRIMFENFYPQGDNGASLYLGNSVWTKGTADAESNKGYFNQRYVNTNMAPQWSNGNSQATVYIRKA